MTQLLKGVNLYFIAILGIFIFYLVFDSYLDMSRHEKDDAPEDHLGRQDFMRKKFFAERNFYMNLFAFSTLLAVIRIRQMVSKMCKFQEDLDNLK
jgi:hypothetical protein